MTDQDEEEKWKPVCEGPSRLSVPGGWLYRVGGANGFQLASIPYDDSDDRLASIADSLSIVKELFEEATFTYGRNQEALAIRTSDVGDSAKSHQRLISEVGEVSDPLSLSTRVYAHAPFVNDERFMHSLWMRMADH